jgi:Rrf2 family protein
MAESTGAPSSYLATVLKALAKARLPNSQAGPTGGYSLAIPPEELTMLEVVDASDPLRRIEACPFEHDEHKHELCPMHQILDEAAMCARSVLEGTTIEDLVRDGSCLKPEDD